MKGLIIEPELIQETLEMVRQVQNTLRLSKPIEIHANKRKALEFRRGDEVCLKCHPSKVSENLMSNGLNTGCIGPHEIFYATKSISSHSSKN